MALAPKFAGQAFAFANGASTSTVPHAIHSIELCMLASSDAQIVLS
jgi:hypothetical protein